MNTCLVENLQKCVALLMDEVQSMPLTQALLMGKASRSSYAAFLIQSYHYVRWTRPLLALASQRLEAKNPALASVFAQKAQEEMGHEHWIVSDLQALGLHRALLLKVPPTAAVRAYIAWNRAVVISSEPAGFLGTAYVLEALSSRFAGQVAQYLKERSGILNIENALRFLSGHGEADGAHTEALNKWLAQLGDIQSQNAVELSARVTRALYLEFFAPDMINEALKQALSGLPGSIGQAHQKYVASAF